MEQQISAFHGREDTILYPSCFDANAGLFEAMLGPEDGVFSDELNHASIIDGIRLCKAKKFRYKHRDLNGLFIVSLRSLSFMLKNIDLENLLKEAGNVRTKLIVTDGVFSMDGNVAPLKAICDIADKYNALTFIDECHATGFFGKTGRYFFNIRVILFLKHLFVFRGTEEFAGAEGRVDVINSTLGKALGGAAGGYTTGPKELIDLLRQKARPYLFSNSLPPPVVACASKVNLHIFFIISMFKNCFI